MEFSLPRVCHPYSDSIFFDISYNPLLRFWVLVWALIIQNFLGQKNTFMSEFQSNSLGRSRKMQRGFKALISLRRLTFHILNMPYFLDYFDPSAEFFLFLKLYRLYAFQKYLARLPMDKYISQRFLCIKLPASKYIFHQGNNFF